MKKKWYYTFDTNNYGIYYWEKQPEFSIGPFDTFTECKKDLIDAYRSDIEDIRMLIQDIKAVKRKDFK